MDTTRTRRLGSLWYFFFFNGTDAVALVASLVENKRDDEFCSSQEDAATGLR